MKVGSYDFSASPWWVWLVVVGIIAASLLGVYLADKHPKYESPLFGPEEVNAKSAWHKPYWVRYIGAALLSVLAATMTLGLLGNVQTTKEVVVTLKNVALAVDCSQSMTGTDMDPTGKTTRIKYMVDDIVGALKSISPDINFGVYCFSADVELVTPITPDRQYVIAAVEGLSASKTGGTLIGAGTQRAYDALAQAGGGAVVVVTDGSQFIPTSSSDKQKMRLEDVVANIKDKTVISTVAYGNPDSVDDPPDTELLKAIAQEGHGFFARAQNPGELEQALMKVNETSTSQTITTALFPGNAWMILVVLLCAAFFIYILWIIIDRP
jgi:hypothetical protein